MLRKTWNHGDWRVERHKCRWTCDRSKKGAKPFTLASYRPGPTARELEALKLKKQLEAGIIKLIVPRWAVPVLFVAKKDSQLRICPDIRKLNEMILNDRFPLICMENCIDSLGQRKVFSTFDAYSGTGKWIFEKTIYLKERLLLVPELITTFVCLSALQTHLRPFSRPSTSSLQNLKIKRSRLSQWNHHLLELNGRTHRSSLENPA